MRRGNSYSGPGWLCQSVAMRGLALAVITLSLGGCAGLGLPFSEAGAGAGKLASGNGARPILAKAVVTDPSDPTDWETIRRTAEGAPVAASRLDWVNPTTGSSGHLAIAVGVPKDTTVCRAFATTINDMRGIRRYRGDACAAPDGRTRLTSVVADDTTLS
jgi:17 kDa outer membrane surface antigen